MFSQTIQIVNNNSKTPQRNQVSVNSRRAPRLIKKDRGYKIGHINIRSLSKHIEEFRIYLRTKQFDIISVNETMLDNSIFDTEIAVHGYELVRNDRNRHALYIRDSINYKIRNDLSIDSLETVTVEIFKPKAKSFLLGIDHQIRQSIYSKIMNMYPKNGC